MDIYLSFEFMESDLHNIIKRGSILKDIHKRYVMYQVLNATNFIHSGNIIVSSPVTSKLLIQSVNLIVCHTSIASRPEAQQYFGGQ